VAFGGFGVAFSLKEQPRNKSTREAISDSIYSELLWFISSRNLNKNIACYGYGVSLIVV
jgi:hypothetical protein